MTRATMVPTRLRFTRSDYHRMGEAAIIPPDARVELLDGEIIRMSPIGPGHSSVVAWLHWFFDVELGGKALCFSQSPLALDEHSEPEPDVMLVRPREDFYRHQHLTPADVLLLIEVADTSLDLDLGEKRRLYAEAGICEYWVVDQPGNILTIHRNPMGADFKSVQEFGRAASVSPLNFPDLAVHISSVV